MLNFTFAWTKVNAPMGRGTHGGVISIAQRHPSPKSLSSLPPVPSLTSVVASYNYIMLRLSDFFVNSQDGCF